PPPDAGPPTSWTWGGPGSRSAATGRSWNGPGFGPRSWSATSRPRPTGWRPRSARRSRTPPPPPRPICSTPSTPTRRRPSWPSGGSSRSSRPSFRPRPEEAPMAQITLARALNEALRDAMEADDRVVLLGEDVGTLGGVFRITDGLLKDFGEQRVMDTPLAESALMGVSVGLHPRGHRTAPQ